MMKYVHEFSIYVGYIVIVLLYSPFVILSAIMLNSDVGHELFGSEI